jgi:hypothetical protein
MDYVEEREFVLRLEVRCSFADDYDGDDDGYAWVNDWNTVAAQVVQAAVATLKRQPGWQVRSRNRGRPTDEEITLVIERTFDGTDRQK